jgi:hypothetical protein
MRASKREPLAPTDEYRLGILEHLAGKRLIAVDPESDIKAFVFDDDLTEAPRYYPAKVNWAFLPGMSVDAKRQLLQSLERVVRDGAWPDGWGEKAYSMWHEIAKAECFEYFAYLLAERGYELETFGEKTHAVFDELLRHYSIAQAFHLTWQSVRDTTDWIVKQRLPKNHARNSFIGAIQRKADRAQAQEWNVHASRRDFNCPQSAVSAVFFNVFAQVGDAALEMVPPHLDA